MEYEKIPGWFDFADIYKSMVAVAHDGARFVEIGAWYGKSTVCMAEYIQMSGKHIEFSTIDNWSGVDGSDGFRDDVYEAFLRNIKSWEAYVTTVFSSSVRAADYVEDDLFDFVFIDGAHDYVSAHNDIKAWLPKVKSGGFFGGHDYTDKHIGVKRAVLELVPEAKRCGNSWLVKIK